MKDDFKSGYWNYRIIENSIEIPDVNTIEHFYNIHEVYYDSNGVPFAWSREPMTLYFEDIKDIKTNKRQIKKALNSTVLTIENDNLIDTKLKIKKLFKLRKCGVIE
jgi:hypothetical protein